MNNTQTVESRHLSLDREKYRVEIATLLDRLGVGSKAIHQIDTDKALAENIPANIIAVLASYHFISKNRNKANRKTLSLLYWFAIDFIKSNDTESIQHLRLVGLHNLIETGKKQICTTSMRELHKKSLSQKILVEDGLCSRFVFNRSVSSRPIQKAGRKVRPMNLFTATRMTA